MVFNVHAKLTTWAPELNGSWFNSETSGQGFLIDYNIQHEIMFIGWFTYPVNQDQENPTQRWLTMQGSVNQSIANLSIIKTTGGVFNDTTAVTNEEVGEAKLTLIDCNHANIEFTLEYDGKTISENIALTKLLNLTESECNTLAERINLPREVENSKTIAITHVNVIPMTDIDILADQTVIISNQKIQSIGPTGTVDIPVDAIVIDAQNKYLMPGINDMHTHLASSISEFKRTYLGHFLWNTSTRISESNESRDSQLMLYLAKGVTSILNTGDFGEPMPEWSRMVKSGELIGPSIYSSHYVRGNRPSCQHGPPNTVANNPAEARDLMQRANESGYDFLKVYRCAPADTVMTVLNEGPELGLPTIGHFPVDISAKTAVINGMKAVAHLWEIPHSDIMPQGNIELISSASDFILQNDFTIISTLLIYELIAQVWGNNSAGTETYWNDPENIYMHPTTVALNERKFKLELYGPVGSSNSEILGQLDTVKLIMKSFHDAGVKILLGTDSPGLLGVAGFSAHDEMRAMRSTGLTNKEIIKIATANGAQFIMDNKPQSDSFGRIVQGYRADLILLTSNPLNSIDFEDNIAAVVARGTWRSGEYFDEKLAEIAAEYQSP